MSTAPCAESPNPALAKIDHAFQRFRDTVSSTDARQFQSTELEDVRNAAKEVERTLASRGDNRALRRIDPLLIGLDHYSTALGVLCNGTPYLPWIWVGPQLPHESQILLIKAVGSYQTLFTGPWSITCLHKPDIVDKSVPS